MTDGLSNDLASLRIDKRRRIRRGNTRLFIAIAVAGLAAAGWLGYQRFGARFLAPEVELGTVSAISDAEASSILTANGFVVAKISSSAGTSLPGRIRASHVKEGDQVNSGDVLLEIELDEQRSVASAASEQVNVAKARAEAAKAGLEEIKLQIERQKPLVEKGIKGRAQLDDLEAKAKTLEKSHEAALAEAKAAAAEANVHQVKLNEAKLIAPISGTIVTPVPPVGETIRPDQGKLIEIVDFDSLVVECDVPELQLHAVGVGTECEITLDAYPDNRYRGHVTALGKRVDRTKATVPVTVSFQDKIDVALPNMAARVRFLAADKGAGARKDEPRTIVPAAAIVSRAESSWVYVAENDAVRIVPVKVGETLAGGVELLEGPPAATRIVVRPPSDLRDGQKIRIKGD